MEAPSPEGVDHQGIDLLMPNGKNTKDKNGAVNKGPPVTRSATSAQKSVEEELQLQLQPAQQQQQPTPPAAPVTGGSSPISRVATPSATSAASAPVPTENPALPVSTPVSARSPSTTVDNSSLATAAVAAVAALGAAATAATAATSPPVPAPVSRPAPAPAAAPAPILRSSQPPLPAPQVPIFVTAALAPVPAPVYSHHPSTRASAFIPHGHSPPGPSATPQLVQSHHFIPHSQPIHSQPPPHRKRGRPTGIPGPSPALQGHPSKPPIMDPPSNRFNKPSAGGFPSPTIEHAQLNTKFNEDVQRMGFAIQQSLPEAVRRTVRDNWEKSLLGSEFHQAFILNASIHHTSGPIIRRSLKDFGSRMVAEAREELVNLLSTADLDAVATIILDKVSDEFLDQALEKRLRTVDAQPLINALAGAGRLGYEPSDIVAQDHSGECVIPGQPTPTDDSAPAGDGRWNCGICGRFFVAHSAYHHHSRRKVCQKEPPNANGFSHSCPYCGQGFTSLVGLQYHNDNKVCGDFGQPHIKPFPTTSPSTDPMRSGLNGHSARATPKQPHTPAQNVVPVALVAPRPTQKTPAPSSASRVSLVRDSPGPRHSPEATAALSGPSGKFKTSYEHLTPIETDALVEELRDSEVKYGDRITEAEKISDPEKRLIKLEGLKNSFSTKQSMIRKKFGVRLRERRSKAQMEEERARLGIQTASMMSNAAIQRAMTEINAIEAVPGRRQRNSPAAGGRRASGWRAANSSETPDGRDLHDAKRQRTASGPATTAYSHAPEDPSPRRRGMAVIDMRGGLGGSVATAAVQDPTFGNASGRTMASMRATGSRISSGGAQTGSADSPATATSSSLGIKREMITLQSSDDDAESSDDDDIPAEIPPNSRR